MARIVLLADPHLGLPKKLDDGMWAMNVIAEYAHANEIDVLVILGDLFHDRVAIPIDALSEAQAFFTRTRKEYGLQWLAFPGNHDMYLKHSWAVSSLKPYANTITVIDSLSHIVIDNQRFTVLPFVYLEKSYMGVMTKLSEMASPDDILLTHVGCMRAVRNACFLLKEWNAVNFDDSKFKRVYTGHFHVPQKVGEKVWYAGSPIPFKMDEGNCDHGFMVFDTETGEHEFVSIWQAGVEYGGRFNNNQSGESLVPPDYIHMSSDIFDGIGDLSALRNVHVKVTIDAVTSGRNIAKHGTIRNYVNSIRESLLAADARSAVVFEPTKEMIIRKYRPTNKSIFESWIDNDNLEEKALDRSLLLRLNSEVVTVGDDLANQSVDD